ncbi:FAD-dependent monooxygenase [Archangium violaceum]|uniref:FAD-dependent monooxygenase n=1 Tax=Archangium violaceum TaxID=83451 RepID=UPI0019508A07|nr:FAD-dependent monooxygenase [Archangium violaceum]QRN96471.1 FAD-dependent monooxygenase [Archangium violaceum]
MKRVLIVGAGPAGAALAYILASRGVPVHLLERQRDFSREFRGEGFQPSGRDVLHQMGLGARFEALPSVRLASLAVWRGSRRLVSVDVPESARDNVARIVSQPALLEMLVEEAGRFPHFRLERGVAVRDVVREGGRVVGVRVERDGHEEELRADFIIGTDGRNSVLRRKADLHEERVPQSFDILWCKVPLPPSWRPGHSEIYATVGGACLSFPSYDGTLQLGWSMGKGQFKQLRGRGVDAWMEELARAVRPELAEHVLAHREQVSHPFLLDVICDRLVRWTAPGLLLIGDAAHPMSPVGGQGVNVALRDALVAANHLFPVLAADGSPEALDAAAARVQAERLPEVTDIQSIQTRQARFLSGTGLLPRLLMASLPLLGKLGVLRDFAIAGDRRFQGVLRPLRLAV